MDAQLATLSAQVGQALAQAGLTLATAESCTGGWVAEVVTHTAGSSTWFDRGFVTYSNEAKSDMLGVAPEILASHGAVSEAVAIAMAEGALRHSRADIALAVTGIAGPGGGTAQKPVGMVCFAWARRDRPSHSVTCHFEGDREAVRRQTVIHALQQLLIQNLR
ncbi:MAG: nicotinamide-nucleotide amidase [Rhodocyclaceae bacterium]|nr:MAG: nicotinamide-nucleotide amidase [Rhodocyclaceae bacterium]